MNKRKWIRWLTENGSIFLYKLNLTASWLRNVDLFYFMGQLLIKSYPMYPHTKWSQCLGQISQLYYPFYVRWDDYFYCYDNGLWTLLMFCCGLIGENSISPMASVDSSRESRYMTSITYDFLIHTTVIYNDICIYPHRWVAQEKRSRERRFEKSRKWRLWRTLKRDRPSPF